MERRHNRQMHWTGFELLKRKPLHLIGAAILLTISLFCLLVTVLDPIFIRVLQAGFDYAVIVYTILGVSLLCGSWLAVRLLIYFYSGRFFTSLNRLSRRMRKSWERISSSALFIKLFKNRFGTAAGHLFLDAYHNIVHIVTERHDILKSLLAFGLALRTLWEFSGLGTSVDEYNNEIIVSLILPMDLEVLLWGIPAVWLGKRCRDSGADWRHLGKWAFYIALVCIILSFTVVGEFIGMMGVAITSQFAG